MKGKHPVRLSAERHGPARSTRSLPADPDRTSRIEDYLDHLCAPLVGVAPYAQRQELRAEWRCHLEALEEAHLELGAEPEEALDAALRQFGHPDRIGREWAAQASAGPHRGLSPVKRAAVGAALLGSASLGIFAQGAMLETMACPAVTALATGPLIPVLAGLLVGLVPERHPLGGWKGMLGIAVTCVLLSASLPPPMFTPELPAPSGWFAVVQLCMWMMMACGSAGFGYACKEWNRFRELHLGWRLEG